MTYTTPEEKSQYLKNIRDSKPEWLEAIKLKEKIEEILPSDILRVTLRSSTLRRLSIYYTISGTNPLYGICQNSPVFFSIWNHNLEKRPVCFESDNVPTALKFRKIKAPTFEEGALKLLNWIEKATPLMVEMMKGNLVITNE
jgi:hypothetical protein